MALTKVSTDGVKDDAITSGKIPANAVGNSELAVNSVQGGNLTNSAISNDKVHPSADIAGSKLADNSISLAKLEHGTSSNDGKFLRANNGADPTFETVTGTTINNNADNRVITGSGTANTLEGEANLIYDGLRLGINRTPTTNADYPLQIKSANATAFAHFRNSQSAGDDPNQYGGLVGLLNDDMYLWGREANSRIIFGAHNGERMRLLSSGALAIGSTSSSGRFLHVAAPTASSSQSVFIDSDNGSIANAFGVKIECSGEQAFSLNNGSMLFQNDDAVGGNNRNAQIGRFLNGSGSVVGVILMNDSTTSYSTSSDYRLKENQTSISDGITRLKQLKPYRFNWKTNPSVKVDGFFAHEVSSVVPESIFGEKDETDSQGNPNYQSMDHSKLVPLLTAALQEEVAKREALEARVAALEAA